MEPITVVKIGGNVVDNPVALQQFVNDFSKLAGNKILVHGGGKEATRMSAALNIPTTMIEGRRVTDKDTLDVVTMVYAGLINKRIVNMLQASGCNSLGLSGADGRAIISTRRKPTPIDYGFVGDINNDGVNDGLIKTLIDGGFVPVYCAITSDGHGTLLNSNADGVASAVAIAAARLAPVKLVFCFEKPGVLADVNNDNSLIEHITPTSYQNLKEEGAIHDGMIPKIDNAFKAIRSGVSSVEIKSAANLLSNIGTVISE